MVAAVETMAYAGEVPWHGLGTKVSDDLTPNQIMVKAGLDWSVNKVPTYAKVGDIEVPTGQEALVRSSDNKVLTQVGKKWYPVQNEEAFEFFSEYCYAGDMSMETAGSLTPAVASWCCRIWRTAISVTVSASAGSGKVDAFLVPRVPCSS